MSKAGVESSMGDAYQTLVGVKWAVGMLSNPSLVRLEVDSTSLNKADTANTPEEPYGVDDVVIYGSDGSLTCCQCKKNSPDCKAWTAAALADDLGKAWAQHRLTSRAEILFYSGSPFGDLARLVKRSRVMPDAAAFLHAMPHELGKEYAALAALGALPGQERAADTDVYALLRQMSLQTLSEEVLRDHALSILRHGVARADQAFDAIRQLVDDTARCQPDSRPDAVPRANHEITREQLLRMLEERGHILAPLRSETELTDFFRKYSSRGRFWPRDIRGRRLVRRERAALMRLVDEGKRLVLVEGEPGGGKTCLLLDVLDAVEQDSAREAVFIQTRDFASADFAELEGVFIGNLARWAEIRPVVLLIDSLDVLSIARERRTLSVFLAVLNRAARLSGVTVAAACRSFDVRYDRRLSAIAWDATVTLGGLDFETEVVPLLAAEGVDPADVARDQKPLLGNPRMLSMYMDILGADGRTRAVTPQELAEQYVRTVVADDPDLGDEACAALRSMGRAMVERRCLSLPESRSGLGTGLAHRLRSAGVLARTDLGYAFAHQTLVDVLAVMAAEADGRTLADFMRGLKPVPFVRPSVRAFFFHLRAHAPDRFVRETRAALAAEDLAFHLKRLLAASLAEIAPSDADRPLLRHLFQRHPALFSVFFEAADVARWEPFFQAHLLPLWRETGHGSWLLRHAVKASARGDLPPDTFADLWLEVLEREDVGEDAARHATSALEKRARWTEPRLEELFRRVVRKLRTHVFKLLGKPLSRWVAATDAHDDLLWEYVARGVDMTKGQYEGNQEPLCRPHDLCTETFFAERLDASEVLLSLAIAFVEAWSRTIDETHGYGWPGGHFLRNTSHHTKRSQDSLIHAREGMEILFHSLEQACERHGREHTAWWRAHRDALLHSPERALQYMGILGCLARPETNLSAIEALLLAVGETHGYPFEYELGCLLQAVAFELADASLSELENKLLHLYEEEGEADFWVLISRRHWLLSIPAPLRSAEARDLIAKVDKVAGPAFREPPILTRGGLVRAPFSLDVFLRASDDGIVRLLAHYQTYNDWDTEGDNLLGGRREVAWELRKAAGLDPERFGAWLRRYGPDVEPLFRGAILGGMGNHMEQRFVRSQPDKDWAPRSTPDKARLLEVVLNLLERWAAPTDHEEFGWMEALQACAALSRQEEDVIRVCFLLIPLLTAAQPAAWQDNGDFFSQGINSLRGKAADAAMSLAARRLEQAAEPLPDMLTALLARFARDPHPAVRAVLLEHLPYIQHKAPDLGWGLLDSCLASGPKVIWQHAYQCLYYQYVGRFDRVAGYLDRMKKEGMPEAGETWGKISALAFLSGKISLEHLIASLCELEVESAWEGTTQVFAANIHDDKYYAACLVGIESILTRSKPGEKVRDLLSRIFWGSDKQLCFLPCRVLEAYFAYMKNLTKGKGRIPYHIWAWLVWISDQDVELGVTAAEMLVRHIRDQAETLLLAREIPALLTRFFREAEDNEEVDGGALLRRVVMLQDELLALGASRVEEWLGEAERP